MDFQQLKYIIEEKPKQTFYKIKWKNYSDKENTWEEKSGLEYNDNVKKMI